MHHGYRREIKRKMTTRNTPLYAKEPLDTEIGIKGKGETLPWARSPFSHNQQLGICEMP